jgi:hypothetical protein
MIRYDYDYDMMLDMYKFMKKARYECYTDDDLGFPDRSG